jgi:deoxyribodipyrimidine photo-lyase
MIMGEHFTTGLVWFRRDLRTDDNTALLQALQQCHQVFCVFVFDTDILDALPRGDRRVAFIRESVVALDSDLRALAGNPDSGLIVAHGRAADELPRLALELGAQAVFAARDYEPHALARDGQVRGALAAMGKSFHTFKDQVVFEGFEVITKLGTPYTVFTPYKRAWLQKAQELPQNGLEGQLAAKKLSGGLQARPEKHRRAVPDLATLGFDGASSLPMKIPAGQAGARKLFADFFERMDTYDKTRDFPAVKGPSYLGVHLRFGTVSIRKLVATAMARSLQGSAGAAVWLSELVWREFYFSILANFPHVATSSFKPAYDHIEWEQGAHAQQLFAAWCEGRTGYPLVDAAMAQINQTGYMHNRLRMVAASFLVKHLGIDWRWGERYFALHLNDFDLSANNGGWQWVASSGCDAQPYFRIFNPVSQSEKFDAAGKFIRRYVPQLARLPDRQIHAPWTVSEVDLTAVGVKLGETYPRPVVDHAVARALTLKRYSVVKNVR